MLLYNCQKEINRIKKKGEKDMKTFKKNKTVEMLLEKSQSIAERIGGAENDE